MTPARRGAPGRGADDRRAAERRGRRAETAACWLLRLKGYRVLARRARTPVGEIDLIVGRGRVLAAVEVKTRPDLDSAAAALAPRQTTRIVRALEWWLAHRPALAGRERRFDLVLAAPGRPPRHLPDAWRPAG